MIGSKTLWAGVCVAMAMGVAGCGSAAAPKAPAAKTTTTAPVSTAAPSSVTATPSAVSSNLIAVGHAQVSGKTMTVLTNGAGMTLYYFTSDTPTHVACTGACAALWPPLTAPAGQALTAPTGVSGTFTTITAANGRQVEYNGHPLYLYAKDQKPGQALGQGLFGKWWVATPGLAGATASKASSTASTTSHAAGY